MMVSKVLGLVLLAFATGCGTTTSSLHPTEGPGSAPHDLAASPEAVVGYVDMESMVDPIEAEGGTLILQVSGQSVRLADHYVNRVMVVPAEPAPIAVIVSGTEQSGLEQTLGDVASLLASVRVEE
jgi:hypothetical protein